MEETLIKNPRRRVFTGLVITMFIFALVCVAINIIATVDLETFKEKNLKQVTGTVETISKDAEFAQIKLKEYKKVFEIDTDVNKHITYTKLITRIKSGDTITIRYQESWGTREILSLEKDGEFLFTYRQAYSAYKKFHDMCIGIVCGLIGLFMSLVGFFFYVRNRYPKFIKYTHYFWYFRRARNVMPIPAITTRKKRIELATQFLDFKEHMPQTDGTESFISLNDIECKFGATSVTFADKTVKYEDLNIYAEADYTAVGDMMRIFVVFETREELVAQPDDCDDEDYESDHLYDFLIFRLDARLYATLKYHFVSVKNLSALLSDREQLMRDNCP